MESIRIEGYKSLKNVEVKLLPITILIGANGAGKSNFLSFFEFLDQLYNQKLQEYIGLSGGIRKFLFNGVEPAESIAAHVVFDGGVNAYSFEISPSGNNFVVEKEIMWYNGEPWEDKNYAKEAEIKFNTTYRANYIKEHITALRKYHFHDTGAKSPFNQSSKVGKDSLEFYDRGENLAAFLYSIQQENSKIYKRIITTIQSVVPHFSDFVLVPDRENNIVIYWQDKYSNYNYDITDFSDGSLRFIALAVLFLQPNPPKTIIIDEPELGLHPFAIAKLAGLIQAVASDNCQVIIATQSAELIAHFEPQDVIAVDNINGETVLERLDSEKYAGWLEEYTLDELWKRNIINKAQPNN